MEPIAIRIANPEVAKYLDKSQAPLFVRRIVCRELLRRSGGIPADITSSLATTSLVARGLFEKIEAFDAQMMLFISIRELLWFR